MKVGLALVAAFVVMAAPARAQPSCVTAIRAAAEAARTAARDFHATIPSECWRVGPLTLGMTPAAVRAALGPPDATEPAIGTFGGRNFTVQRALYVYPRDLPAKLREQPVLLQNFQPKALRLIYSQNKLVAITVGNTYRVDYKPCAVRDNDGRATQPDVSPAFPYAFNGIALGTPLASVIVAFGRFTGTNNSKDLWYYWPLPIAIDGGEKVDELAIANSMLFIGMDGAPHFIANRTATCRIQGFRLQAAR